jgi:hypothetical protein
MLVPYIKKKAGNNALPPKDYEPVITHLVKEFTAFYGNEYLAPYSHPTLVLVVGQISLAILSHPISSGYFI